VVLAELGGFAQLVDNDVLGGNIRITKSQIDDVSTSPTSLGFQLIDLGENVRG
jgi:hypothetical protein